MARIAKFILRQLGGGTVAASASMTKEQKAAQKRVRKAMKAVRHMHRI